MATAEELTGWKFHWWHWHHVTAGVSDCGKFTVQILGGGRPRKPWPKTLAEVQRPDDQVCAECVAKAGVAAKDGI